MKVAQRVEWKKRGDAFIRQWVVNDDADDGIASSKHRTVISCSSRGLTLIEK